MKTVFLRVLEAEDKGEALRAAVRGTRLREVDPTEFAKMPGSPFAYWIGSNTRSLFARLDPFESHDRTVKQGLASGDDFRLVRIWWEVQDVARMQWLPLIKGGRFAAYYADVSMVLDYSPAAQVAIRVNGRYGRGATHYYRPGLTWPLRGARFSSQAVPSGCLFSIAGKMAFPSEPELGAYHAVFNSASYNYALGVSAGSVGGVQFEAGLVQRTPVPELDRQAVKFLAGLSRHAWSLKRSLDTRTETSHALTLPALLQVAGADLAARAATWSVNVRTVEANLAGIQAEIDERCFDLYGIDEADRRAVSEGFGPQGSEEALTDDTTDAEDDAGEDSDERESTADAAGLAAELIAWAVGVAFGRFDVRLATGARPMPDEPGPFDPLPSCPPGMLTGRDGLPLARPPAGYPLTFPETGILVDDPGYSQDLTAAVRAVFDVVFGLDADHWWNDVAALLDPRGHNLRGWLAGSFFEHHLKLYSKSRRKAPILWQLGTPSGRYSVWLYAHRLTRDSFFQLQNEVVGPKLTHEERQLTSLTQNAGGSPSASERKEIAAQESIIEELREMLDEVKRVAPLWDPNLDDGVVLTMAPLWRLVPQYKPWQKELKARWDELATGKYDWAHLAMHLWPERVVPKCTQDRSLAIAHDLEEVFWEDGANGIWEPRSTPLTSVEELVRERSSSAVKATLRSLLSASVITAGTRRGGSATRVELSV